MGEIFRTERINVRRLTLDDIEAMYSIYSHPDVARYVDDGKPILFEDCEKWIKITDQNFIDRGYGMMAFESRSESKVIGCGGIVHPGGQPEPEIKYAFHPDFWGKGLATEVITSLLKYAHEKLELRSFITTVHPENKASQNVLTKLGFRLEKTIKEEDGSLTEVWKYG